MRFDEFGLKQEILQAITELGFETPTEIQERVIPALISGRRDLVGLAQTGTGKTAAFGLPLVHFADPESSRPQSLVLAPTRELCLQIAQDLKAYAARIKGLKVTAVYGGAHILPQIQDLARGTQIVVATPGRLVDLISRKRIDLSRIERVVLDEADIMLNMGFKEELDSILQQTPEDKIVLLLSATMPQEVARIASTYMKDPEQMVVGRKNEGSKDIEHHHYLVHGQDKYPALKHILDFHPDIYGIVFCRTKVSTQEIADKLTVDGYNVEAIHSDLSQAQRDAVMSKFRSRGCQLLIATDVAARGLDVSALTHIIHYDLPDEKEYYVHRSGRTGRAGRKGMSLAIITPKDRYKITLIERSLGQKISHLEVPTGRDICRRQLMHAIDKIHKVEVDEEQIEPYLDLVQEKLADLDREALLKHFLSLELNRFLDYYKKTPEVAQVRQDRPQGRRDAGWDRGGGRVAPRGPGAAPRGGDPAEHYDPIQVNLGWKDRVLPPDLINIINRNFRGRRVRLARIDIGRTWSQIEVEQELVEEVMEMLRGYNYRGKPLAVRVPPASYGKSARNAGRRGPEQA